MADDNQSPPTIEPTVRRIPPNRVSWGTIKMDNAGGPSTFEFYRTEAEAQRAAVEIEMGPNDFVFVVHITGERV